MNERGLEVTSVDVTYANGFQVLWDVSLSWRPGEAIALAGANGAGKSSLLKAVAGSVKATKGSITLDGAELIGRPAHTRASMGIGHVLERRQLFDSMSVLDNLIAGAWTVPRRERHARVEYVLDEFPEVAEHAHKAAGTLSGGQQQLVAIARALVSEPSYMVCDEPFLGLSPAIVDRVAGVLARLKQSGVALLIVEQDVLRLLDIVDRCYVLRSGRVADEGKATDMTEERLLASLFGGLDV
jgi:branched-chain amino acid transport system ATP-binding protein